MTLVMHRMLAGTLLLPLVAGGPARADEGTAITPPLVVTATRTAQPLAEAPVPTTVISRQDIERRSTWDIGEWLRFQPALSAARTGGPGQPLSLFLQGSESNHTLVMVDGVPIQPGTLGHPPLQHLPPDLIERVEIVQAPRSALYGSQAIGGVIQIFTRQADHSGGYGSLTAGPDQARRLAAGLQHRSGNRRFGLHATADRTEGFPPLTNSDVDRGHHSHALSAHAGTTIGAQDISLRHWRHEGEAEYLDFAQRPAEQHVASSATLAQMTHPAPADGLGTLRWSRFQDRIRQKQSPDDARTRRDRVEWQVDLPVTAWHTVTAGVLHEREDVEARSFGTVYDTVTDRRAIYLQDQLRVGSHRLLGAVRHAHHDGFGDHVTGDAAYGYRWAGHTRVDLFAGTAFRAPDATDRFGFGGNPDLAPETSRQWGLAVQHRLHPRHSVSARLYVNRVRDLIEYDGQAMRNVGAARIRGTVLTYRYEGADWGLRLGVMAQSARDTDTGEPLPRRPRRRLTATLARTWGAQVLTADFLAESARHDSAYNDRELGGYALLNLSLRRDLSRRWSASATLENVFDKKYALADGYTTQDRALFLTLRYEIGRSRPGTESTLP